MQHKQMKCINCGRKYVKPHWPRQTPKGMASISRQMEDGPR